MATANPKQLNPNAPLYIPLPPPVKIWTPQLYYCHVIPTNCQLLPPELLLPPCQPLAEIKVSMFPLSNRLTGGSHRNRRLVGKSGNSGKGGGNEALVQVTEETVMMRNIPKQFNRQMMIEFLDKLCYNHNIQYPYSFRCEYDFLYLPMDFRTGYNLGYAFVNFTNSTAAHWIKETMNEYKWGVVEDSFGVSHESNKICRLTRARIQGNDNLVKHFQASKFTCLTTDYLPVILLPPRDGTTSFSVPVTVGRHLGSQ